MRSPNFPNFLNWWRAIALLYYMNNTDKGNRLDKEDKISKMLILLNLVITVLLFGTHNRKQPE
ncbi:hypothetical protein BCD64_05540 [Nostoc sp. MBR 210]|nr:hypothetical protein BCD64_05540 [Nostoc sp. MBR 210]